MTPSPPALRRGDLSRRERRRTWKARGPLPGGEETQVVDPGGRGDSLTQKKSGPLRGRHLYGISLIAKGQCHDAAARRDRSVNCGGC